MDRFGLEMLDLHLSVGFLLVLVIYITTLLAGKAATTRLGPTGTATDENLNG